MPRSRRGDEAVTLLTSRFGPCATTTAGHATADGRNARRRGQVSFHPVLREIAEYPNSFGPLGPKDERIETDRYTLCMGPGKSWNTVQRQRMRADEVGDVLEEVRTLLRSRGRHKTQWEVGSAAEPPGLVELLLERGLAHDKDPYAVALVLTREPPLPQSGLVARRVETFDEFVAACQVQWEAFEASPEEVAEARALLEERWRESVYLRHAVWLDGRLVCTGTAAPTAHGL